MGKKVIVHRPPGVEIEIVDDPNTSKVKVAKKERSYDGFWDAFHEKFVEYFVERWSTYYYRPFYHRGGQFLVVDFVDVPKKKGSCRVVVRFPHQKERASREFSLRKPSIKKILTFIRETYIKYYKAKLPELKQKIEEAQERYDNMKSTIKEMEGIS